MVDVCQCSAMNCGKYYHAHCLQNHSDIYLPVQIKFANGSNGSSDSRHTSSNGHLSSTNAITGPINNTSVPVSVTSAKKPKGRPSIKSVTDNSSNTIIGNDTTENDIQNKNQIEIIKKDENNNNNNNNKPIKGKAFMFKCPYHHCYTCAPAYDYKERNANKNLQRCAFCPRAYHINCITPGSRFNNICLLCNRHPDKVLPQDKKKENEVNTDQELTEGNENNEDLSSELIVGTVSIETTKLFFEQISVLATPIPKDNKLDDDHFRLPRRFQEESKKEPRPYKSMTRLDYGEFGKLVSVYTSDEECHCIEKCGTNCYNYVSRVECNDTICQVGKTCGNRRLQNSQYAKYERFQEFEMGWGLRAKEFIPRGNLVIEYIGEVIDGPESQRRLQNQRYNTPSDKDYYIMALGWLN